MNARLHDAASEVGMTLIEVLVSVSILSIAIITIVAGLGATIWSSDVHRKEATADTVARSYAEVLRQYIGDGHYVNCQPAAYNVPPAWWTPPSGFTVTNSTQYWQSGSTFTSTCPAAGDLGAQRITVIAQSTDNRDTERFDLIVRQP